jgi:hypothetical protein
MEKKVLNELSPFQSFNLSKILNGDIDSLTLFHFKSMLRLHKRSLWQKMQAKLLLFKSMMHLH